MKFYVNFQNNTRSTIKNNINSMTAKYTPYGDVKEQLIQYLALYSHIYWHIIHILSTCNPRLQRSYIMHNFRKSLWYNNI